MTLLGRSPTESRLEEYTGYSSIETCLILTILTTVFLSLRFYSKFGIMRLTWGAEDTLLAIGYLFHEALCIVGIRTSKYSCGRTLCNIKAYSKMYRSS